ncbi:MAG: MnhB domain-containing protein [Chloroflexota bacterium]|nr:MnhB domain-containing protein [Chloroflexota bacterium]
MTTAMTRTTSRILLLPILMVAVGVLIKGYADVGDGFSAGVIASLGIVLQGVAFGAEEFDRLPLVRYAPLATFAGLFLALAVAFAPVLVGDPIFLHQPEAGTAASHFGALEFITPVLFDIGVFLIVFGFCVGSLGAVARETVRREREQEVLARQRREARSERPDRGGAR